MVKKLTVGNEGFIQENCYIFFDELSLHCYIIDPGANGDIISNYIDKYKLIPKKILITHGHFDHIGSVDYLRDKYKIDAYVYGKKYVENSYYNLSYFEKEFTVKNCKTYNEFVNDEKALSLSIIHTPGHTEDSVILYSEYEKMAFVGDLIFKENIGNYTFPGGDKTTLLSSIHNYIFKLPYNTILYTGHGENTTVLQEKFFHDNHTF